jgi:hypothetical protein
MNDLSIRDASPADVDFLSRTIIEAEKSGTERLSYTTIFGLSEEESKKYIAQMLAEEVDGCELSISSFMVAEVEGEIVAASSAWIEGYYGISSSILKGNLLNHCLPRECIERASRFKHIIQEMHVEYSPDTIQIGSSFVDGKFRGRGLIAAVHSRLTERLKRIKPEIKVAQVQIFSCNTSSLRAFENAGFSIVAIRESSDERITRFLPSNKKYLLTRVL